jgi:hypothetical protein
MDVIKYFIPRLSELKRDSEVIYAVKIEMQESTRRSGNRYKQMES